jgi:hypothetical protein
MKIKFEKEIKQGYLGPGILSKDHVAFLTNIKDFEESDFHKYREVIFSKPLNDMLLEVRDGYLRIEDVGYPNEYIEYALDYFEEPIAFYYDRAPLVIKGTKRVIMIAPKVFIE